MWHRKSSFNEFSINWTSKEWNCGNFSHEISKHKQNHVFFLTTLVPYIRLSVFFCRHYILTRVSFFLPLVLLLRFFSFSFACCTHNIQKISFEHEKEEKIRKGKFFDEKNPFVKLLLGYGIILTRQNERKN